MVLDHELWSACMLAVDSVVGATSSEVFAKPGTRLFEWLRRSRTEHSIGSLKAYCDRLQGDPSLDKLETDVWNFILWRNQGVLIAAASRENWLSVGGPPLYHDSYTTSLFVRPADTKGLVKAVEFHAGRVGACVEAVCAIEPT